MTKAVTLAELADQNVLTALDNKVGIATTNPQSTLQVGVGITMNGNTGIITAQAYYGDGSNLTGVDSTALKDTNDTIRVQATTSGAVVTGILTATSTNSTDVVVTGVVTATTFDGNLTGIVTGNVTGNLTGNVTGNADTATTSTYATTAGIATLAQGLSGTPNITVGDISATGNVSIGGTLTYEDVTNVDSVGIITAQSGIKVGAGQSISAVSGIITYYGDGSQLTGIDVTPSWTLGTNGSNDFSFTGPGLTGTENDPTFYLTRGQTYKFVNETPNPLRIQSDPNGSNGSQYNDGLSANDVSNGTLTWDVQFDTPDTLFYQCTAYPDMGGIIYIGNGTRSLPNISKSSAYTLIKTDTGKLVNMTSMGAVTVPANIFSPGDIITVYNNSANTMQIQASSTTLRKAGSANTGTCTIDNYGTASILCVANNEFVVSGNIA